jgi:hypothetical protein
MSRIQYNPEAWQDRAGFDDVADDAAAAFKEVSERTEDAAPAAGRGRSSSQAEDDAPAQRGRAKLELVRNDDGDEKGARDGKPGKKPGGETDDEGRDEKGRFTSKAPGKAGRVDQKAGKVDAKPGQVDDNDEEDAGDDETSGKPDDKKVPVADAPPPSFSVKTKAGWEQLPEHVRADILKRETEMAAGLKGLQDFKDLKPWAEMASKHNTTIAASLERYVGLENLLRKDFGQGLRVLAQNFGMSQAQAAEYFSRLGAQLGGKAPAGQASDGQDNGQDPLMEALRPVLGPIMQELNGLKGQLTARQAADQKSAVQALSDAIGKFSKDPANKFYADVEGTMTRLFETGYVAHTDDHEADLKKAYDLALSMTPSIQEALIEQRLAEAKEAQRKKEQEAADKAKNASRSITGSRAPGTVIKDARDDEPVNHEAEIEAEVRKAYRLHAQV